MDKTKECEMHYRIPAHPTEFADYKDEREIDIYVTEPREGINDNTGIMLIIHGAGAYAESAYFEKLRKDWANRYNVITLGVNYLGTKERIDTKLSFPDDSIQKLFQKLTTSQREEFLAKNEHSIDDLIVHFPNQDFLNEIFVYNDIKRSIKDYCDYGFIQAIDCLYAVYYVLSLCSYYGIKINKNRIFAYGSSLGGYLAQMCLRFAPSTFRLIADNSGFVNIPPKEIFPVDMGATAKCVMKNGMIVSLIWSQLYSQNPNERFYFSPDMFQIRSLDYSSSLDSFGKLCKSQIFMFHGRDDLIVNADGKNDLHKKYLEHGIESSFFCFSEKDVDNKVIKNSGHAMGADIKKLFEKYCDEYCIEEAADNDFAKQTDFDKGSVIKYNTENGYFIIDYSAGVPSIKFERQ